MKSPIKIAVVLCAAGAVAGCDAGAQLAVAGAVALFGVGVAAISEGTKEQTSYCSASSGQIYSRYGDCAAGDREVDSAEYQKLYKQRAADETRQKIAATEAARNAKTYCLGSLSGIPYSAASGYCQSSDEPISESEYKSRKTDQANNLSAPPTVPIENKIAPEQPKPAQSADAEPSAPPLPAQPQQQAAPAPKLAAVEAPRVAAPTPVARDGDFPIIPESAKPFASGSAFFIAKGRLLTNHHVIDGCDWVGLITESGIHPALTLSDDPKLDLAVLQTDYDGEGTAVFADRLPDIGEDSYVAGFPLFGKLWALNFTNGIVSSQSPGMDTDLLQTTAPVQHGNSGGPMFDASGHIIGVVVARIDDSSVQNINFAIKGTLASEFVNGSGFHAKVASRGKDLKASAIAKSAKAMVVPAVCFKKS